jgi:hypothetical protein
MTDAPDFIIVEDPPSPDLPDLMQRTEIEPLPAVSVHVEGSVLTMAQPARTSTTDVVYMNTTPQQVLSPDMRRSRCIMWSSTAWLISDRRSGVWAPVPVGLVVTILHAGEMWAKVAASSEVALSVISEYYAQ